MAKPSASMTISLPVINKTGGSQLLSIIVESLIAMLFVAGMGGLVRKVFLPEFSVLEIMLVGLIGCILFTVFLNSRRIRIIGLLVVIIWLVIFSVALLPDMLDGLRLVINHIGRVIGRRFGEIAPLYDVLVPASDYLITTTLFLIPICLLLSLFCSWLVYARDVIISLLVTFALLFAIIFLRVDFPFIELLILTGAMILLLAKAHERRKYFYGNVFAGNIITPIIAIVIFAISALVLLVNLPEYNNPLQETRMDWGRKIDRARYGVDQTMGMPDGDFRELGSFSPSSEIVLEVTMAKPESLWLRGFVGSQYDGVSWQQDDNATLFAQADLFYWLHKDNFYGQKQLADAAITADVDAPINAFGIHINNVKASSRNIYAPYEVYLTNPTQMLDKGIGDVALTNTGLRGLREYQYFSMPNQVKRYPEIINRIFDDEGSRLGMIEPYLLVESNYAQFVYEQYTRVPETVTKWINEYLSDMIPQSGETNYSDARQAIIKYFTTETKYSTDPSFAGSGDLAYDFLFLDKSGYSIHYATAATLLFRAYGIPARYVEGYIITPKDIEGVGDNSILQIDATHAHAWTEVYQNGVGWIPVEVTPSYFGLMEEADTLTGVPNVEQATDIPPVEDEQIEEQINDLNNVESEEIINQNKYLVLGGIMAILVLILIIILLVIYLVKRNRFIQKRLDVCLNESNSVAIIGMYTCAIESLKPLGFIDNQIWLASHLKVAAQNIESVSYGQLYQAFLRYEEARYSNHELSDEKRSEVTDFTNTVYNLLKERYRGLKGLKVNKLLKVLATIKEKEQR